ncbi:MAG TPA: DUF4149 domain-containing protein [Candidatus Aquilonibacter sp.]|nr:DUF4149 domain-containing protein [Candidatus Aquilonibacter sp.]
MTTLLRIIRLYSLALWVGGEVFFVIVAGISFKFLPDAHTAGIVVRNSLLALHRSAVGEGVVYILATLGLLATARDRHRARIVELALIVVMLVLTLYSQMAIMPRMETDRLTLGGDVTKAPANAPARKDFEHLHSLSVDLEGAVLIGGLAALALAAVHGKRDLEETAL